LNGYRKTYSYRKADFIFLFTCAFCQGKVREMLDHLENIRSRKKDSAEVIVGSCLPKIDPGSLRDVFDGRTLIPTDFSALNSLPPPALPHGKR
jgi:tRNA A37 methylthiotransferase MiaB